MHVIVIGSGIAALSLIRQLDSDIQITCITHNQHHQNNSYAAQGGICFSKYERDGGQSHIEDTYQAGAKMGDYSTIERLITRSHAVIQQLLDEGAPFDRTSIGALSYGVEGAHSQARILHAGGDQTGRLISKHLAQHLNQRNVTLLENMEVFDLLENHQHEVTGVRLVDQQGTTHLIEADAVVCATGGISNLFNPSSNQAPSLSTGALLAFHHDVPLHNMEMIQFHPTLLGTPKQASSLISEAVRGAGAVLINEQHETFMDAIHPLKSLAPRDITSRAIFHQQQLGHQCYLDIRPIEHFKQRFPTITKAINHYDSNLLHTHYIPVTPGAHYTIGGIEADINGQTRLPRFLAIGETACTHFHGANRLASNSLLEGLVMGVECANYIQNHLTPLTQPSSTEQLAIPQVGTDIAQALQQQSFDVLGVERDGQQMTRYLDQLTQVLTTAQVTTHITSQAWQNYSTVKLLQIVATAALERPESCGVHFRKDAPTPTQQGHTTITEITNGGDNRVKSLTRQRETSTILHRR